MTENQHFIPASYIAQFSEKKEKDISKSEIFYFDKRINKPLKVSADYICKKYLYFDFDTSLFGIENKFNAVENELAGTIEAKFKELIDDIGNKNISFGELNLDNKNILLHYMLHLYIRTENIRDNFFKNIENLMNEKFKENKDIDLHKKNLEKLGKDPNVFDIINTPDGIKNIAKIYHSSSVLGYIMDNKIYNNYFKSFENYNYFFIKPGSDNNYFISSDNPIVKAENLIIFPITKETCIIGISKNNFSLEGYKSILKECLDINLVNGLIAVNSRNIIYGNNEKVIEIFKGLVSNKEKKEKINEYFKMTFSLLF